MPATTLTDRQLAFVREYGKDFNGKNAAIRAGYSIKGADVAASRLLRHPAVRTILSPAGLGEKQISREKSLADIEQWKREVGKIAFANLASAELTHDHKLKGLDMYGRHLGAFQAENPGLQQAFQITIHVGKEE